MKEEIHIEFENGSEIETVPCNSDSARGKRAEVIALKYYSDLSSIYGDIAEEICKSNNLKWHQRLLIKYWYGSKIYRFIYHLFGGIY